MKVRELLASDLASSSSSARLSSDPHGKFVAERVGLAALRRSREDWRSGVEGGERRREAARAFLDEIGVDAKKRKKMAEEKSAVKDEEVKKEEVKKEEEEEVAQPPEEPKFKKKKKKAAKSYLDDL